MDEASEFQSLLENWMTAWRKIGVLTEDQFQVFFGGGGVPQLQPHCRSGLATLPSVVAIP